MAGVIDSFLDFIAGKGPLKKAEKVGDQVPDPTKQPAPTGVSQSDIAASAQKAADKAKADKAKKPATGGMYDWRNQ